MLKEAIQKIEDMTHDTTVEVNGRQYSTVPLSKIGDPMPEPMAVHTLTGLVNYLDKNKDALATESLMIHVHTPTKVTIEDKLTGDFKQRPRYLQASHLGRPFRFGDWYGVEKFIIALQAHFEDTSDRGTILKYVSGLTQSSSRDLKDDGVAQRTVVRQGISRVAEVDVPSPVTLQPYRTFLEVDQPESKFVFRLRADGGDGLPSCSLHEADGGAWELDAIVRIKDYLEAEAPDIAVIA